MHKKKFKLNEWNKIKFHSRIRETDAIKGLIGLTDDRQNVNSQNVAWIKVMI